MKKIFFAFLALLGFMTSCTNDDIEIAQSTTVKVDPSSVLSTFTYEVKPGELTMFDTSFSLRITVLAYDKSGILAAKDVVYCKNYSQIGTASLDLSAGTYNLYAITDVFGSKIEYWKIEDEENLATTKIVDQGYIGGKNKILGVATTKIEVESGISNEYTLKPEAAGALCLVQWFNIHQFSDVEAYELSMNKTSDFIQFTTDEATGYSVSEQSKNGSFAWRLTNIEPDDYTSNIIYGYYFVFPTKNVAFRYTYKTKTGSSYTVLTDSKYVSFERGGEYWFALDLNDEEAGGSITYACGVPLNQSRGVDSSSPTQKLFNQQGAEFMYLDELAKTVNE